MSPLAADYERMKNTMFHNPPSLDWIVEQLNKIDEAANKAEREASRLVSTIRRLRRG